MAAPLQGFHHIAIIASDYARSKSFYVDILGAQILTETYRAERQSYKLDLRFADGSQLELFSFPNPPPRASYGIWHLRPQILVRQWLILRLAEFSASRCRLMN